MSETEKTEVTTTTEKPVAAPVTTDASQAKDNAGVEVTQITTEKTKED